MRPITAFLVSQLELQRGHMFVWSPVLFALGIGTYFALKFEPSGTLWRALAFAFCLIVFVSVLSRDWGRALCFAVLLGLGGFLVAGMKAHRVAEVTLDIRFYGAIEGRIIRVDRSASDAVRLTLDRVVLEDVTPENTPARVRVALHGLQGFLDPEPGVTVILTGHLSPPGSAVEPGGYDFRRQAWFQRLGAVGYTRTPVLALAPHDGRELGLWLYRLRMGLSAHVQEVLPGRVGAIASAITTGDRAGIDEATYEALRASNLAHLLAISGLHMGLLTGFVFAALRFGLAALPRLVLYVSTKKIAAFGALCAGAVYLALSGGNVATERAFIMVAVMFCAVLVNRRAITLRSVAIAAMIVLTLRPEALYGPGFQMSFAATTALVTAYGMFRQNGISARTWPRWVRVIGGVAVSSLIAGMATAPIGAAHFNQVPHYGLVANVLSVPLMGAVIIPGAVLAACLAPFGLEHIGLYVMAPAIGWILSVADEVSSWDGAVSKVISPDGVVLPLMALGFLWLALWQGRMRWAGVPVPLAALVIWTQAERPVLLVAESGGLIGVLGAEGRVLSKPKGDGFAAQSWLENDGDRADQATAAARIAFDVEGRQRTFTVAGQTVLHATGKVAAAQAVRACTNAALVVVNVPIDAPETCLVYDRTKLQKTGALAVHTSSEGLRVFSVRETSGRRLWSP